MQKLSGEPFLLYRIRSSGGKSIRTSQIAGLPPYDLLSRKWRKAGD